MTKPIQYGEPVQRVLAVVLVALAIVATGCSGNRGHASAAPSATAMTEERLLTIGREHAQCLRDHGIPDVGEPNVWQGLLRFGGPQQEPDPVTADAAYKACQSIADQVPASHLYQNWKPTSAEVDAMATFADCVRQHGFPDWPDPNGSGQFPIRGTPLEGALKTDQGQVAVSACQKLYDGPVLTVTP